MQKVLSTRCYSQLDLPLTLRWVIVVFQMLWFQNGAEAQTCPPPADFNLITPCYVNGSRTANPNEDVLVLFNHATARGQSATKQVIANYSEIGTVWGLAYNPFTKKLYAAAFLKRHCDLSPDGLGAIYEIDLTTPTSAGAGAPTLWMNLNSTTHLGAGSTAFPTETAANRGLAGINTPNYDIWAYTRVGKQGLGDIELSEDGTKMYVMDLTNRQVLEISMATKTVTNRYAVNAPANYANADDRRPFAIKHHNGELYIGVVSSGETGVVDANLRGTIMKLSGSSFVQVLDMPNWTYRDCCSDPRYVGWNPYTDDDITDPATSAFSFIQYPVPLISDIEFDENDNMVIGVMDWSAHRVGAFNYAPELGNTNLYNIQAHGDVIKADKSGSSWNLESDIGNFYDDMRAKPQDGQTWPIETFVGGMVISKCNGTELVVANIQDPFDLNSGGSVWMKTSTGMMETNSNTIPADEQSSATAQTIIDGSRIQLFSTPSFTNAPSTFGKAAGLGDMVGTFSTSCVKPTAVTFTKTAPTCTSGTANNNGKITFTSVSNADKYFINSGATSTGTYATATAIPATGTDIQTSIPNTGGSYTIRFYNAAEACYKDTTITVAAVTCTAVDCNCTGNLITTPSFEGSDLTAWTQATNDPGGTILFSNDNPYAVCGSWYGYIRSANADAYNASIYQNVTTTAGTSFTLNVYAGTHDPGQDSQIRLQFFNSSNTLLSGGQTVQVDTDVDVSPFVLGKYTLTGTAPAGTSYVRVTFYTQGTYNGDNMAFKFDQVCLQATACTKPSSIQLTKTAATCTGSTANNNGKITLASASNTDKCGISTLGAATYDGPVYASATAYAANKDVKTAIPNTGGTYILRLFNGSDNCYKDTTITVAAVICSGACTLTLKPTVSGCYQNNGSKATVSVEVSWTGHTVSSVADDASDVITVTFGGQTKIINPGPYTSAGGNGSIVSPQVVAFEVTADASSQTAQAFTGADYASSTCKIQQTGIVIPAACPPTVCASGQTGGTVWNDYNADGIKQAGETTGIQGVTVKAYDCNGTLVGTTTTDVFGKYAFTGISAGSYPIRVEFSNLPSYAGQGTINGTDGRTTVQFVNAADCNVDLGILDPSDYCQTTPQLFVPCYVSGDPVAGSTSGNGDALVSFTYGTTGLKDMSKISVIATADKIGTLWGMAYSKQTKKLYGTAVIKRHAGLGPQGIGGLYTIDLATNTVTGIDLASLGVNVGSIATNTARGMQTDPSQPSADAQGFTAIGKEGLGDLDINANGNFLYVVSLKDKKLNKLDISGASPTLAASYAIPDPGCTGGDWRPFALKVFKGKVYVGGVCDAQTSDSKSNLRAYVYTFDEAASSFNSTPIFDFPLTYPKGFPQSDYPNITGWYPWSDDFSRMIIPSQYNNTDLVFVYPQPMFTDIEFDIDGSMLLGFGDRGGMQSGLRNADLTGSVSPRWVSGFSGGDILRATYVGNTYILENAAKAGASIGYGPTNNQGPGFGEYYNDDFFYGTAAVHTESAFGGLALRPGSGEVITTSMDPIDYPNTGEDFSLYGNTGGIRYLNNSTGLRTAGFILYTSFITSGTFGKATGLGDIEVGCGLPTYLEIGNRVWNNTNKNGVQDPCEKVLAGVNVSLYKGSTKLATSQTNANGEYYFSSKSKIGTGTWSGTGADTTLLPNTAYKLVFGEGQLSGGKLTIAGLGQFEVTLKDATASNGNDQNDSDAEVISGAFCINLTTGAAATVNHTFDAGFVCVNPSIGNKLTKTLQTCTSTTENNDGKISLSGAITPYDKFRVKTGTGAWTGDTTYATATAIGSSFPKDLITSIPNAGATYVIRFYTGECCFKDTTIVVDPKSCLCVKPNAGADQTVCAGTSATLTGTSPTTGTWTAQGNNPAGGTLSSTTSGVATVSFAISASGSFKYIYTVTGCSDTLTITVNAKPTIADGSATICAASR